MAPRLGSAAHLPPALHRPDPRLARRHGAGRVPRGLVPPRGSTRRPRWRQGLGCRGHRVWPARWTLCPARSHHLARNRLVCPPAGPPDRLVCSPGWVSLGARAAVAWVGAPDGCVVLVVPGRPGLEAILGRQRGLSVLMGGMLHRGPPCVWLESVFSF